MPCGRIVKGIGGFYYVKIDERILECRVRGKFRNEKITPLVGDIVEVLEQSNNGIIEKIEKRKNELIRPPVANVDQAVIVMAAAKPEPNMELLDRFLLLAEYNCLDIIICINKIDLKDESEVREMLSLYSESGYKTLYISATQNYRIDNLKDNLKDKITVFAGPSGVGKSSILNALQPSFKAKTGVLSDKIDRGKHTTRHSELLQLDIGGYVVDTPGFSSLDIDFIDKGELQTLFPEFQPYLGLCKFSGCSHISEPKCKVKEAVAAKKINERRYNSYVKVYEEISRLRRNYK